VQALKGQTDNEWASNEAKYGWFAYLFHWTPEQVDKIPYDRLTYLMTVYKEIEQKKNDKRV
jgi:hypothetical protein